MESSEQSKYNEDEFDEDEHDFSGEDNFNVSLQERYDSEHEYDEDESDTYYSEGLSISYRSGPSQHGADSLLSAEPSFYSSRNGGAFRNGGSFLDGDSFRSDSPGLDEDSSSLIESVENSHKSILHTRVEESYRSSSHRSNESYTSGEQSRISEDVQSHLSPTSMTDREDLPIWQEYIEEFEELIQQAENGHAMSQDKEERLYFLELYARRRVGEELDGEEELDLEDFLREERLGELSKNSEGEECATKETYENDSAVPPLENQAERAYPDDRFQEDNLEPSSHSPLPIHDNYHHMPLENTATDNTSVKPSTSPKENEESGQPRTANELVSSESEKFERPKRIETPNEMMVDSESGSTQIEDRVHQKRFADFDTIQPRLEDIEAKKNAKSPNSPGEKEMFDNQGFAQFESFPVNVDKPTADEGFDSLPEQSEGSSDQIENNDGKSQIQIDSDIEDENDHDHSSSSDSRKSTSMSAEEAFLTHDDLFQFVSHSGSGGDVEEESTEESIFDDDNSAIPSVNEESSRTRGESSTSRNSQFSRSDISRESSCSNYSHSNYSRESDDSYENRSQESQSSRSSVNGTELPSFAEDTIISPFSIKVGEKGKNEFQKPSAVFENEVFDDNGFGQFGILPKKGDEAKKGEKESGGNKSQNTTTMISESADKNHNKNQMTQDRSTSGRSASNKSSYSRTAGESSNVDSETPSFAEEPIFSPFADGIGLIGSHIVPGNKGFSEDGFGNFAGFSDFEDVSASKVSSKNVSQNKESVTFEPKEAFDAFIDEKEEFVGNYGFKDSPFGGDTFADDAYTFRNDSFNNIEIDDIKSEFGSRSRRNNFGEASKTEISENVPDEIMQSDEDSLVPIQSSKSPPSTSEDESYESAFKDKPDSWSRLDTNDIFNESNSVRSGSRSARISLVLSRSSASKPRPESDLRSQISDGKSHSSTGGSIFSGLSTSRSVQSNGKKRQPRRGSRRDYSDPRPFQRLNSRSGSSRSRSESIGSSPGRKSPSHGGSVHSRSVSTHHEAAQGSVSSVQRYLESKRDDASKSIISQSIVSTEVSQSIVSTEEDNDEEGSMSSRISNKSNSISSQGLEKKLSKAQDGLIEASPEEKSIFTTGDERSVRFDKSPKSNYTPEASLDLGEVFEEFSNEEKFQRKSNTDVQPKSEESVQESLQSHASKIPGISVVSKAEPPNQKKGEKLTKKLSPEERKKKRKKRRRLRKEAKSAALLDLVANVNDAMFKLKDQENEMKEKKDVETSAHQLLHGFDAIVGIYLQLSDEIELISTFSALTKKSKKEEEKEEIKEEEVIVPRQALKEVLSFAESLDQLFADLKPIIVYCFEKEPGEDMDDMLFRLNSLVDLLCEMSHRVGEKQEWNNRIETTYVTLLELIELETLELQCYFEDVDVPDQGLSANIHEAWSATGHIEELRALQMSNDPWIFRQICYEVMVSTDQWCPDVTMLMEICGIDASMLEEEPDPEYLEEEELAPVPQLAEHVLDKVNGDPLPRSAMLASVLRRILPPRAMTDMALLDNFTSIRNTLNNPLGLSATNIVAISSEPEVLNDPKSLGVGGIGKTTLAAMVAEHPDVRRYFIDGVVWIYIGDKELTYSRYTQCLRELVAQLDFYEGVPLFAELIHTPGEILSKQRRREEGFMIYARDTIVELLKDRSVLIILDNVCFEPDLDWFDFAPMPEDSQDDIGSDVALLVTTRCRDLLPAADTVEVDMFDEADAIRLLIQESGQLSHILMAESREARSVVKECANHPLAVKSVGRWLNLKHATAGVVNSVEEIHAEVIKSMDKILKGGDHSGADMTYEILSLSLSPTISGEPTNIIKFCLAAFVIVFCDKEYISDFAMTESAPIIPMDMAELLFETLLEINESSLLQEGSLFYAQKKEAAVLIPEALSALGVLKVIAYSDTVKDEADPDDEQKFLQVMHFIHHEYGEYLCHEEEALKDLTKDAETEWNRALVVSSLKEVEEWDMDLEDAGHSYALEMIVSHMIRGGMYKEAADLLANKTFVRGRLLSLGRENATRRHIKDCAILSASLHEGRTKLKLEPRSAMKRAYQTLGSQLTMNYNDEIIEDPRIKGLEIARAHFEIGFSLAENRCWDASIAHWETSQELLEEVLGTVEIVAGILYNIGVAYAEMNDYEQALDSVKKCLRIRGTIHGEQHILYAQTIQKIGDIFLGMSDYHEAVESYNWALDVMSKEPTLHRVEIGEILDNKGTIHYSKGEIDQALQCHQEALRSKQLDLGEDHPELCGTYHYIGNCLSDQGNIVDAVTHFEEAIRLKKLDLDGGPERDADILTYEGILRNLEGKQDEGLECYEKSLQILVTKVAHRKEKVASLLHLIGCVYLMSNEQKKAMKLFEESLQARRKVLGFVHLDVASTLFNMAFLHQTRNRLDKALKCLEEALKIRQLRLPNSEKVAVTHEKIGSLARAIGKTKKAQIAFEAALVIRKSIHGDQHEAVATVMQELGDLMDDIGEYDNAMTHYINALDIRRHQLGLDDIAVGETLYSMGYTLHNNDEPDRALVCFEESLSIRRYQLGEDSKEVGDTLNMMGFLKAKRGELEDALTILWNALRIRKLQQDNIKVSETLKNIGNVHREKQDHDLAVKCYEECLRIRKIELGEDHEKVADALIAMGNIHGDMIRNDDAMSCYQEALKIRTTVFGEQDGSVAVVLQYMGTMEFRSENYVRARDLLTEFIRIRRENNACNDGDYVNVLFMMGMIHKKEDNTSEARVYWNKANQVFQKLDREKTNPQITAIMNDLLQNENMNNDEDDQAESTSGKRNGAMAFLGKLVGDLTSTLISKDSEDISSPSNKFASKIKRRNGKGIQL